jgi:ABC-2 type transport system permease protein
MAFGRHPTQDWRRHDERLDRDASSCRLPSSGSRRAVVLTWFTGTAAITAMSVNGLATREDLQETQPMARNPAMRMLARIGPSIGGYTPIRGSSRPRYSPLMSSWPSRQIRQNEELGRADACATVVGRYASLAAAVLVAAASNIVLASCLALPWW